MSEERKEMVLKVQKLMKEEGITAVAACTQLGYEPQAYYTNHTALKRERGLIDPVAKAAKVAKKPAKSKKLKEKPANALTKRQTIVIPDEHGSHIAAHTAALVAASQMRPRSSGMVAVVFCPSHELQSVLAAMRG